jgi:hypothetical protein
MNLLSPESSVEAGATLSADSLRGSITYPNHEELAFSTMSFLGALPILWIVGAIWVLVLLLWLENEHNPFFIAILGAFTVAVGALGVLGIRSTRSRTPTSIEIGSTALTAVWAGSPSRKESIPYDRITSVDPQHWHWSSGRGGYARFTPSSVQYSRPEPAIADSPAEDAMGDEVVYLTDQNADRVRAAVQRWGVGVPVRPEYSTPTKFAPSVPGGSLSRDEAGAAIVDYAEKCNRCGCPLKSTSEQGPGVCADCGPLPS